MNREQRRGELSLFDEVLEERRPARLRDRAERHPKQAVVRPALKIGRLAVDGAEGQLLDGEPRNRHDVGGERAGHCAAPLYNECIMKKSSEGDVSLGHT